ncbi:MAG: LON peptidase substrate-binding domain-containing protein [Novosphingobium sp.]|nr:LON peptidase substrate-binding domain-containing protein [Novosphingobium sp.]
MGINKPYSAPPEIPAEIPVFPLAGALLLPRSEIPLNIFEPRYLAMIDAALAGNRLIGMVQPAAEGSASSGVPDLARVGCAGRITAFQETGDGRVLITLTGISRFDIVAEAASDTPYRVCRIDTAPYARDFAAPAGDDGIDRPRLLETLEAYLNANDLDADWDDIDQMPSELLVNLLSMMSPYGPREKQALLEAHDIQERSEMLIAITERVLMEDSNGETLQ